MVADCLAVAVHLRVKQHNTCYSAAYMTLAGLRPVVILNIKY